MLKINGTEIHQRITELALEALGRTPRCASAAPRPMRRDPTRLPCRAQSARRHVLQLRKLSIFGGSNEIQRNILAKAVLGL